jgi:ParB family transcriptional regulator, chromosome partitioning protein
VRFLSAQKPTRPGGIILRDLFDEDEAGWLQDVPLLEKLIAEKLAVEAATIKTEGWGWIETAVDFPWNHLRDYAALRPLAPARTDDEEAELEALIAEFDEFEETPFEDLTPTAKKRLGKVKQLISHLESFSPTFDEAQKARAGAFVSLQEDGTLMIQRGYVRREDMAAIPRAATEAGNADTDDGDGEVFDVFRRGIRTPLAG